MQWGRAFSRPLVLAALLGSLGFAGTAHARSYVGVTTFPSFRLGNDLGRFDWYFDLQWNSWVNTWTEEYDTTVREVSYKELTFSPSLGCNVALYDSVITAYVGGFLGTDLRFQQGVFTDEIVVKIALGGGMELRLRDKVSLVGEYLIGFYITFLPDLDADRIQYTDHRHYGFHNRPSLQLRYYIGPPTVEEEQ